MVLKHGYISVLLQVFKMCKYTSQSYYFQMQFNILIQITLNSTIKFHKLYIEFVGHDSYIIIHHNIVHNNKMDINLSLTNINKNYISYIIYPIWIFQKKISFYYLNIIILSPILYSLFIVFVLMTFYNINIIYLYKNSIQFNSI